jgi:hypothetical protein
VSPQPQHFLVIGAQRSGTTYLHDQLDAHPGIAMARPGRPEPKVFLSDEAAGRGGDWYRRTFFGHAADGDLLGEKSTSYIESDEAPARVRAALGDTRIVAQLRDPISRAVSNWKFSHGSGLEERPLGEALAQNLDGPLDWDPQRTSVSPYAYLERGRYAAQLERWLAEFPGLVRVQFLEELVAAPDQIGELYAWLGVDDTFRPAELGEPVHESGVPAQELDDDLRTAIRAYFDDADRELATLLGRDLPWRTAVHSTGHTAGQTTEGTR